MKMRFYIIKSWNGTTEVKEFLNEGYVAEYVNNLPADSKASYREVSKREARLVGKILEEEVRKKEDEKLADIVIKFSGMRKVPRFV